jgi:hypothetical protein
VELFFFLGLKSECGQSIVEPGKDPDLRATRGLAGEGGENKVTRWLGPSTYSQPASGCTEVENGDKTEKA